MTLPPVDPTASQLAEMAGVPPTTLKYWVDTFELRPYRDDRNRMRFLPPAVEAAQIIARLRKDNVDGEVIKLEIKHLIDQLPEPAPTVEIVPPELPRPSAGPSDSESNLPATNEAMEAMVALFRRMESWEGILGEHQDSLAAQADLLKSVRSNQEALLETVRTQEEHLDQVQKQQHRELLEALRKQEEQLGSSQQAQTQELLSKLAETQARLDAVQTEMAQMKEKQQDPWYKRIWK